MKYFRIGKIFLGLGVIAMSCVVVYAAPGAKPFAQINDQLVAIEGAITDMNDQIDALVTRVETVEARAIA